MAAEAITRELQLDLYKIDLSQIVSKYIGTAKPKYSRNRKSSFCLTKVCFPHVIIGRWGL